MKIQKLKTLKSPKNQKKNKKIKIQKKFSQILETNIASQISCLKNGHVGYQT